MYIFVTNLSRRVDEDELKWLFDDYGFVEEVNIWVDHSNNSTRFAIVEMEDSDSAKEAIKELDGMLTRGRFLWVERAPKAFGTLGSVCSRAFKRPNAIRPFESFKDS